MADSELDQALKLTQQMLDAAGRDAWDDIATLDRERQQLLAHFDGRAAASRDAAVASQLIQLAELNQQLQHLCEVERERCVAAAQQLHKGRNALRDYATTQKTR